MPKVISNLAEIKDDNRIYRVRFSVSHTSSTDRAKCIKLREKGELKPATSAVKKG